MKNVPLRDSINLSVDTSRAADKDGLYGPFQIVSDLDIADAVVEIEKGYDDSSYKIVTSEGGEIAETTTDTDLYIRHSQSSELTANLSFTVSDVLIPDLEFIPLESVMGKDFAQSVGFVKPRDAYVSGKTTLSYTNEPGLAGPKLNITTIYEQWDGYLEWSLNHNYLDYYDSATGNSRHISGKFIYYIYKWDAESSLYLLDGKEDFYTWDGYSSYRDELSNTWSRDINYDFIDGEKYLIVQDTPSRNERHYNNWYYQHNETTCNCVTAEFPYYRIYSEDCASCDGCSYRASSRQEYYDYATTSVYQAKSNQAITEFPAVKFDTAFEDYHYHTIYAQDVGGRKEWDSMSVLVPARYGAVVTDEISPDEFTSTDIETNFLNRFLSEDDAGKCRGFVFTPDSTPINITVTKDNTTKIFPVNLPAVQYGKLEIQKTDNANHNIGPAAFELYDTEDMLIDTFITDTSGYYLSEQIPVGGYYLVEVSAPVGFELDSAKIGVEITNNATAKVQVINIPVDVPNPTPTTKRKREPGRPVDKDIPAPPAILAEPVTKNPATIGKDINDNPGTGR